MVHTVKGFGIVDEMEVDVFLEFTSFLCDPVNVGKLISGSSTFSKPSLDIWKFLVRVMLKSSMQDFKHDLVTGGDIPWENHNSERHMYHSDHCSTVYSSQDMGAAQMPIDG